MNRADRMLDALADGLPRTRHEIFNRAGCFFLTNNAASELRARGVDVVQWYHGQDVVYQIVGPLEATVEAGGPSPVASSGALTEAEGVPLPARSGVERGGVPPAASVSASGTLTEPGRGLPVLGGSSARGPDPSSMPGSVSVPSVAAEPGAEDDDDAAGAGMAALGHAQLSLGSVA